jgi:hypothetical protein
MLPIQRIDQAGEVAYIILKSGRVELDISFENGWIYIPPFYELVDILGRKEIFLSPSVPFEIKDRFINL